MSPRPCRIVLCALPARDERVIAVILARVTISPRFRYEMVTPESPCDIAVIDPASSASAAALRQLRERNPQVVALALVDSAAPPGARHIISRRTLWSHLVLTLDSIATHDVSKAAARNPDAAIVVPAAAASTAAPAPAAAAATANLAHARLNALVIDDSATVRAQLEAALRRLGVGCSTAASWDQAEGMLNRHAYDILFLDVVMPGIDGYEACRRIRRNPATRSLPVLMLTSRSSAFDRARGALAGCDMYLIKPIDLSAFHAAVNKVVSRLCHNDLGAARMRGFTPVGAWPST